MPSLEVVALADSGLDLSVAARQRGKELLTRLGFDVCLNAGLDTRHLHMAAPAKERA